jgi:hypothetical protein
MPLLYIFSVFLIGSLQKIRNLSEIPVKFRSKKQVTSAYILLVEALILGFWYRVFFLHFTAFSFSFFHFFLLLGIEFIRQKGVIFYVRLCGGLKEKKIDN